MRGTSSTGQAFTTLRTDSRPTCSQAVDVPGRPALPVRRTYPLLQECYSSADSGTSYELVSQAPQLPSKDTARRSCRRPSTWSISHEWSACCNRHAFVAYSPAAIVRSMASEPPIISFCLALLSASMLSPFVPKRLRQVCRTPHY